MEETPLLSPASEVRTSSPACKGSPFHPLPQEPPFFRDRRRPLLPPPHVPAAAGAEFVTVRGRRRQSGLPPPPKVPALESRCRHDGTTCKRWRRNGRRGRRINGRRFSLLLSVVGPRWAVAAAEGEVGGAPKEGEADAR